MVIGSQLLLTRQQGDIGSPVASSEGVDLLLRVFLSIHLLINVVVEVLFFDYLFEFALPIDSSRR